MRSPEVGKQVLLSVKAFFKFLLSDGWFSRAALITLVWFAYDYGSWAKAFASTALTLPSKPDLVGVGATVAAVAGVPIAFMTLGLTKYMEMKAKQPIVVADRRKEEG